MEPKAIASLESCPFCGSEEVCFILDYVEIAGMAWCRCIDCHAAGPTVSILLPEDGKATMTDIAERCANSWNKRTERKDP